MAGEMEKTQLQVHAVPLRGLSSASFRTSEPALVLPGRNKTLSTAKKKLKKDAVCCHEGGHGCVAAELPV